MRTMRRIAGVGISCTAAMLAATARATEGGASFYLLGSGGPEAALLPPVEGLYFDNTLYLYSGKAGTEIPLVVGGSVVAGLEGDIAANFATLMWVPSTAAAGGTLALALALPFGYVNVDASAILTGPGGAASSLETSDDATVIGDPVATAALAWSLDNDLFVQPSATLNIPIGKYRKDELANLSFHRWIFDASLALSWHDSDAGWDVSGKIGFTFNGTNDATDYQSGNEFHAEAALERTFSPAFSAGLQAYYFDQLTGDSGAGAVLGPNKGRVTAIGATAAWNFEAGSTPVTARVRAFQEFNARRRLEGTAVFLSLTLPLKMNLPAGAP